MPPDALFRYRLLRAHGNRAILRSIRLTWFGRFDLHNFRPAQSRWFHRSLCRFLSQTKSIWLLIVQKSPLLLPQNVRATIVSLVRTRRRDKAQGTFEFQGLTFGPWPTLCFS